MSDRTQVSEGRTSFREWYEKTFVTAETGDRRYDVVDLREAFYAGAKFARESWIGND